MLQWTRVSKGISVFWGNATLGGRLSHLLEGRNVTQVLPLEPPAAWEWRRDAVGNYLTSFSELVWFFSKERPINCERHGGGARGCWGPANGAVQTWCMEGSSVLGAERAVMIPCPSSWPPFPCSRPPLPPADTQSLCCRLGCYLFPNGTARSFYEVSLNGTAFLTFHVPTATWERRWPGRDAVASFAQQELTKYPQTTHDLQHFLNTTCVDILRAQSTETGPCRG